MDTKAAFEKWYQREFFCREMLHGDKEIAWHAWEASRAAIEIDLPYNDVISDSTDQWWDRAVDACSEAITSHGIRIKGKTS